MAFFYNIIAQVDSVGSNLGASTWEGGGNYATVMVSLLMVFGLLVAVFFYLRRFGFTRPKKNGELEILETRPLGGRQFLVVGRCGQEKFLLGVCPGRIDYLCSLEGALVEGPAPEGQFSEIIDRAEKNAQ